MKKRKWIWIFFLKYIRFNRADLKSLKSIERNNNENGWEVESWTPKVEEGRVNWDNCMRWMAIQMIVCSLCFSASQETLFVLFLPASLSLSVHFSIHWSNLYGDIWCLRYLFTPLHMFNSHLYDNRWYCITLATQNYIEIFRFSLQYNFSLIYSFLIYIFYLYVFF